MQKREPKGSYVTRVTRSSPLVAPFRVIGDDGSTVEIDADRYDLELHFVETGRVLEDPFTMFWNGLPLTNLSRKVEIDLLERLGVTARIAAQGHGLVRRAGGEPRGGTRELGGSAQVPLLGAAIERAAQPLASAIHGGGRGRPRSPFQLLRRCAS